MQPLNFWLLKKRVVVGAMHDATLQKHANKIVNSYIRLGDSLPIFKISEFNNMVHRARDSFQSLVSNSKQSEDFDMAIDCHSDVQDYYSFISPKSISLIKLAILKQKLQLCLKKLDITKYGIWLSVS